MKTYLVSLARTYAITIKANNCNEASRMAEFFVGTPNDLSNKREREMYNFIIKEIDIAANDAVDAELSSDK